MVCMRRYISTEDKFVFIYLFMSVVDIILVYILYRLLLLIFLNVISYYCYPKL